MDFTTAVRTALSRYIDFQGRSARAEYWYFKLAYILLEIVLLLLQHLTRHTPLALVTGLLGLLLLALIIPSIALDFRRLHDIDKSAWWILIGFIPLIGGLVLLYWVCQPGARSSNRFGPDPLGPSHAETVAAFS